jgi:hypothetical protein
MTFLANNDLVKTAANIATALLGLFMGVQLLLAVGVLPISIAWGGQQTELTPGLRLAGVAAFLILGLFIAIIRYRAGLLGSVPAPTGIRVLAWVVSGFMVLNTLGNLASVSNVERFVFGPITIVLAVTSFIVAASRVGVAK